LKFFKKFAHGVRDSKKLSVSQRENWYKKMTDEKLFGNVDFTVSFSSPKVIDTKGLTFATKRALSGALSKLSCDPNETLVLLDGGLHAPKEFIFQETIIKGDDKIQVISLASISAKVTRDRLMTNLAKKYPDYGFEKHKGYGTKKHYEAIKKFGITDIHRKSFL